MGRDQRRHARGGRDHRFRPVTSASPTTCSWRLIQRRSQTRNTCSFSSLPLTRAKTRWPTLFAPPLPRGRRSTWNRFDRWFLTQRVSPQRPTCISSLPTWPNSIPYFSTPTWRVCAMTKATNPRKKTRVETPSTRPKAEIATQLTEQFRELRLPIFRDHFQETADRAATENLSHLEYLSELTTLECEARREGRINTADDALETSAGQDLGDLQLRSLPLACDSATGDSSRRIVPGSSRECSDFRQARLGQESCLVCVGRTIDPAGPQHAVHDVQPAGAAVADCQTRSCVCRS